ncbi:PTS transporter subunit EIIC [Gallaecimonas kandeliae]|uniref:PTS transporter subunit EIIC n=1 Tax=Gallaecimonas kandeliae TaxID=3029055 RepID=UPI00264713F0|nr:PTS transporter subunit EIIC [Gallaecimonas kandeliae]WKE64532.1 PTS transporter subunit EIIC [Gallaecimonas kandeliae]
MKHQLFARAQRLGQALMLPVAILPAAGLILGLGAANPGWLPDAVAAWLYQTGDAVFAHLGLLFAVGVATGLSRNDGSAALAAVLAYLITIAGLDAFAGNAVDTGAAGGVLVGLMVAYVASFSRNWQPPSALTFFSGPRLLAALVVVPALLLSASLATLWPSLSQLIAHFSHWVSDGEPVLAWGLYGVVDRLLSPLGLQHIWNVPFFTESGGVCVQDGQVLPVDQSACYGSWIRGEVRRFLAGDPSAGHLAGGYLTKLVGLPMAGLAIWLRARPEERAKVGGIMLSGALASMVTGVTEPLEFAFLFVAPVLYVFHALMNGLAFVVCIMLGVHHGMSYSQGLIDFVAYWPLARNLAPLFWLMPLWGALYFVVFYVAIGALKLATPGRTVEVQAPVPATGQVIAEALLAALGGRDNLLRVDACITRLRLQVADPKMVDKKACRRLGASGVLVIGQGVQLVFGARAAGLRDALNRQLA